MNRHNKTFLSMVLIAIFTIAIWALYSINFMNKYIIFDFGNNALEYAKSLNLPDLDKRSVKDVMMENLSKKLTIDEMKEVLKLSPTQFLEMYLHLMKILYVF